MFCHGRRAGFLSCQPASLGLGAHPASPKRSGGAGVGGAAAAPVAARRRSRGAANLAGLAAWCAQRAQVVPPNAAKESTTLQTTGASPYATRRQKVVPSAAAQWNLCADNCKPLQTRRPVLDRTRPPPPHGARKSPPQPRLNEVCSQIKNSVKMHPVTGTTEL